MYRNIVEIDLVNKTYRFCGCFDCNITQAKKTATKLQRNPDSLVIIYPECRRTFGGSLTSAPDVFKKNGKWFDGFDDPYFNKTEWNIGEWGLTAIY